MNRLTTATDRLISTWIQGRLYHGGVRETAMCAICAISNNEQTGIHWINGYTEAKWGEKSRQTGYSINEIWQIEYKFEQYDQKLLDNGRDPFEGLCHVFDYLISLEDYEVKPFVLKNEFVEMI